MWYMGSINSIPSESLCSLEAGVTRDQDRKVQAGLQASYFSALEPHPAADSNRTCSSNQINEVMTLNPDHNTNYKLSYVVTTPELLAVLLLIFSLGKKFFPFTHHPNLPTHLNGCKGLIQGKFLVT